MLILFYPFILFSTLWLLLLKGVYKSNYFLITSEMTKSRLEFTWGASHFYEPVSSGVWHRSCALTPQPQRKQTAVCKSIWRHHLHPLIRVQLSVHGQRKPEQRALLSAFPDDMSRVQVEGEHQSRLQEVKQRYECSAHGGVWSLQQQQHRSSGASSVSTSWEPADPGAPHRSSARCRVTAGCRRCSVPAWVTAAAPQRPLRSPLQDATCSMDSLRAFGPYTFELGSFYIYTHKFV